MIPIFAASRARQWPRWLAAVGLLQSVAAAPARWERLAPLPVGNGGFVGGPISGEIVVAGGTTWQGDNNIWLDRIWVYSPVRNAWREAGRLEAPVAYAVAGQVGDTVWYASGSSGGVTHRSLWALDGDLAPRLISRLDRGCVYAAGARIGLALYVVGGTDDQARLDRITNQFLAIDLKTGAVTRLPDYPETSLTTGTAAAVGTQLFVFGGARWDATSSAPGAFSIASVATLSS